MQEVILLLRTELRENRKAKNYLSDALERSQK